MTPTDPYVGFEISQEARIIFIIIGIFYVVMGTFGNLLIIVTVASHRVLRTLHGIYIVNLAVADLIILGYVVSYLLVDLMTGRYSVAGPGHCVFNGFLIVCAYVASLLTLTVISINRYLNICHSDTYRRVFTKHTTITICVCIWVVAALMTLPPLVGWGRFRYDRKLHYCGYDRTANFGYTLFLLLGSIAAPAIIIFICNFYIYRYVRNAKNRIRQTGLPSNRTPKPAEISLIKTLFAVFLCFAALMSPYMITTIADRDDTWPATVHIACSYTSFTNSCVNWFLYGLMNRSFREGYKKTLCFWRQPTQLSPDNMHVDNVLPGASKISDRTRSTEEGNGVNHIERSCNNLLTVKPYTHYPKYESTCM
ncbi:melatonin receptor type 1B-A-like [Haliotis rufescens]|uniref:melatonin receptor type 1B-A-like n=1 Tax=Haliotis rufescens TaxID=6454 RepID=UPI001EAFFACC|nr:melatonin receptor type 1B-A-like [Haliotis rufescens]XP_048243401.1 melatonin receptor type 1B-A-like [Haliotis rufescens]